MIDSPSLEAAVEPALTRLRASTKRRVVFLTGAGISAESGIPTFRGTDGFWQPGNAHVPEIARLRPEELATNAMFERAPEVVWPWYLFRRARCHAAEPNAAHLALVQLEAALGDHFRLVTQNIDGLHKRAGSRRVFEIHGNIDTMRCTDGCTSLYPLPYAFDDWEQSRPWDDAAKAAMVCPACGAPARPHVLWFDECYDEEHFKWDSTLNAVSMADLLVVVGTAGATNLPNRMAELALARKVPIIDVNPTENPFASVAERSGGAALIGTACDVLPALVEQIVAASGGPVDRVGRVD